MSSVPSLIAFADLAERLADCAKPVVMGYFRQGVTVDDKQDHSPVTQADREAEAAIRQMLAEERPEDGILGEEYGSERLGAPFVWVIDPIDGTKSFITGKPLFGTLIALCRDGVPVVGVIDAPATGERWVGIAGHGTRHTSGVARTRSCERLDQAVLMTTSPDLFDRDDGSLVGFQALQRATKMTVYGADCYAYGLLASGYTDVVCEAGLKPYDFCALAPVVQEAGGLITDWAGAPLSLASAGRVVAVADRRRHGDVLAVLKA